MRGGGVNQDPRRSGVGKRPGRLEPKARVPTGNDGDGAAEIEISRSATTRAQTSRG
jgi:hypothetical protein